VVVYAAPVVARRSDLYHLYREPTSWALPIDRLIYSAASAEFQTPSTFAGSTLTITAPNLHTILFQPNYGSKCKE
jgi:hypothetical protein